jgi:hypothetical protein
MSRLRVDTRKGDTAGGVTFTMLERPRGRAEVAVKDRKLMVDGVASLTIQRGSYRYGDELQAQLYTREPHRVEGRKSDGWSRIVVYLGPLDLALAEGLEELAQNIRAGLK